MFYNSLPRKTSLTITGAAVNKAFCSKIMQSAIFVSEGVTPFEQELLGRVPLHPF